MIKRKIIIINPKFQYKLAFTVTFMLLVFSAFYPYVLHDQVENNIELATYTAQTCSENLGNNFVLNNSPEQMRAKKQNLIYIISMMQVALILLIFIFTIFIGNRIAGPIYKAQKYLTHIKEGGKHDKVVFRKSDHFQELADTINETFDSLEERSRMDFVYLSEVGSYLRNLLTVIPEDKKAVILEIIENLEKMQSKFSK